MIGKWGSESKLKKNTGDRSQNECPSLDAGYWILDADCWQKRRRKGLGAE